jgi:hypothetical protein
MIFGGKRVRANVPVGRVGDRHTFSVAISGNTIKTIHTFTDFGRIYEVLIKVPALVGAVSVVLTLHDADYQAVGDARFTSSALGEISTHDIRCEACVQGEIPFDRMVHPGDTLRIAANAGTGTEVVTGVIYETGA